MNTNLTAQKGRSFRTLEEEYIFEMELANRLRNANSTERVKLYSSVYDEFYSCESLYSKLYDFHSLESISKANYHQLRFLQRFIKKDLIFVEIGAGDCSFLKEITKYVKHAIALDVSLEICNYSLSKQNLQSIIFEGIGLPFKLDTVNLVYSHQVIEHLHPEDAKKQLIDIYRTLVVNGIFVCITPNRLNGPHDISKLFDSKASGLHLNEYTTTELFNDFRLAGFDKIKVYCGFRNIYFRVPIFFIKIIEKFLDKPPLSIKKKMSKSLPFRILLGIIMVGIKN